jgi:hypothetical protein
MNARTYAELGRRARAAAASGPVLVDATFRYRRDRDAFAAEAGDTRVVFIECVAPAEVVAARAAERERDPSRVSDAGEELARRQRGEFEPLDEVAASRHLCVRTDRRVDEIADDVEALLDARLVV